MSGVFYDEYPKDKNVALKGIEKNTESTVQSICKISRQSFATLSSCRLTDDQRLFALTYLLSSQGFEDFYFCHAEKDKGHKWISVTCHELDEEWIVDPMFKDYLTIARPSSSYSKLLARQPQIFAGSIDSLTKLVEWLTSEAKASMKKQGLDFPPWRQTDALLDHWRKSVKSEALLRNAVEVLKDFEKCAEMLKNNVPVLEIRENMRERAWILTVLRNLNGTHSSRSEDGVSFRLEKKKISEEAPKEDLIPASDLLLEDETDEDNCSLGVYPVRNSMKTMTL